MALYHVKVRWGGLRGRWHPGEHNSGQPATRDRSEAEHLVRMYQACGHSARVVEVTRCPVAAAEAAERHGWAPALTDGALRGQVGLYGGAA